MGSSSLVMFGAVGLLVVSSGCRIEANTQTQFEDDSKPAITSVKAWAGERITVQNDGVNPVTGTTGVEIKIDPSATHITASATFAAHADDDKKTDADAAIADAAAAFTIDESNGFTIHCAHGGAHGSASVAGSGCKLLTVTVPAGTVAQALDLVVGNGNGDIRVGLADAGSIGTFKNLIVDNNGSGDVSVRVQPVPGANIVTTGQDSVQVAVPAAFSSQKVTFAVAETDPAVAATRINFSAFAGLVNGGSYPPNAATADAALLVSLESKGILDLDTVTLVGF
jgi:hypothetical protein